MINDGPFPTWISATTRLLRGSSTATELGTTAAAPGRLPVRTTTTATTEATRTAAAPTSPRKRRLCLPACGPVVAVPRVESDHQLPTEPLSQPMRRRKRLQLPGQLAVSPEREHCLRALLERCQVKLLQPPDLRLREARVAEIRERIAAPE